jgi:predicted phage terminase large subunit-like protein
MISPSEIIELEIILKQEEVRKGVNSFWHFCKLKDPLYYSEDKQYLKDLCNQLQDFYESKLLNPDGQPYRKLILNVPPRHGKTRTLTNLSAWIFGKKQTERIIECSYNDESAGDFAKYTRDVIAEENNTNSFNSYVFNDFFPGVKIKYGTNSYYKWALEGQYFNYLGAGIGGSITGKGGTILIIDDPIKLAEEAFNEDRLNKIWNWYTGTFLSRGEIEDGKEPLEIICMTRWSEEDLCGRILSSDEAKKWYVLKLKAFDVESQTMLCDKVLSLERYRELEKQMVFEIFQANYNQETITQTGKLYQSFKIYTTLPENISRFERLNYTDTADTGEDYLCSINYIAYNGQAYILNVYYTKAPMETTEPGVADFLHEDKIQVAFIESNNGGRGFARAVEKTMFEKYKDRSTVIKWFHQSENKLSRIYAASAFVQNNIFFPSNWKDQFPEFYKSMNTFLKEGKNKHDDAQDCISGVAERLMGKSGVHF